MEELHALEQKNSHLTVVSLFGIPDEKNFVLYVQKIPDALWYIVGIPAMVKKVAQILGKFGIMDTQIRIEEFSGYHEPY